MPDKTIITDTSVLIALDKINLLEVLCKIYKDLILPEGVIREFGNIDLNCQKSIKILKSVR
jgi:predicted nucleic acid-binding protein